MAKESNIPNGSEGQLPEVEEIVEASPLQGEEGQAPAESLEGNASTVPAEQETKALPQVPEEEKVRPQMPWELVSDGTSLTEVQIISEGDQGKLLGDPELLKKIEEFLKGGHN